MIEAINVLIVEDSEDDSQLMLRELHRSKFNVVWERVETAVALHTALMRRSWDIVLADYRLPEFDAPTALKIVQQTQPNLPFIVVSGTIGEELAVELMKAGAQDYLMKHSLTRLPEAVRREVKEAQIRAAHQKAALELAQTQERLQLALVGSGIGLWDWSVQTGAVIVNEQWVQIIGYTLEELHPIDIETWRYHTHPEDLQKADVALERLFLKETQSYEGELRMRHKSGRWVWILTQGNVVAWDATGQKPLRMIGTHLDISDRKQSEAAIRFSEERLQLALAASGDGLWDWNITTGDLFRNPQWSEMLGFEPNELPTQLSTWEQLVHPDDLPWVKKRLNAHFRDPSVPYRFDYRMRTKTGEYRWLACYGKVVLRDRQGKPLRMIGTHRDITERKQIEEQLRKSTVHLKSAQRISQLGSWEADLRTDRISWSEEVFRIFGLDLMVEPSGLEELQQMLYPDDRAVHRQAIEQAIATGQPYEVEVRIYHADGTLRTVLTRGEPVLNAIGQVVQFIGTVLDISDRKLAEQKLQHLNQSLEIKVRERTQELRRVNNLQRAILNSTDFSIISTDLTGTIQTVNSAAQRMLGYSAAEMLGKFVPELIHDQSEIIERAATLSTELGQAIPPNFEVFVAQARQDIVSEEEWTYIRKDGSRFPALLSVTPLKDINQRIVGFLGIARDITTRKQFEQQRQRLLQEVSTFKQALVQSSIVAITDAQGIMTYVNDYFCEVSGYAREELIGQAHSIIRSGYHPRRFFQEMWNTITSGQIWQGEICNRHKDGGLYWLDTIIVPFLDPQGQPFQYFAIRFDITNRKLAREQLQQENTFRQQILESMAEGLCVFHDVETFPFVQVTIWNRKMQEITGYSLEEINQRGWYQTLYPTPALQAQAIARIGERIITNQFITEEGEIQRQDGQQRTISLSATVLSSIVKQDYLLVLVQDISDRKLAEQTLHLQSEQETLLREITLRIRQSLDLQTIFDTACQEIRQFLQADRVGIFKFFPESRFDDGEFVAEAVIEGLPSVLAIPVHDHCFGENFASRYAQGKSFVVDDIYGDIQSDEYPTRKLSACHIDVLAQFQVRASLVMPLLSGDQLWGLMCIHQCTAPRHWQQSESDFTQRLASQMAIAIQQANLYKQVQKELADRLQAEAKLTESNQQLALTNQALARATKLKDEFLANMSHELRSPFNAILGMNEGLQEQIFGPINERQQRALKTIESSCSHLLELINDILDVAKIEAGHIELDYASTPVTRLCQSSMVFIKEQALRKSIQLETKLPPRLPPLWVDERRIRQVLINLLTNAVKFTPDGGHITLEVFYRPGEKGEKAAPNTPNSLRIAISDTGIGIAPENMERLFQPFVQIDSALNRQYMGTGLGLALVKQIVELHGGQVELISELGVGSCFTIALPCIAESVPATDLTGEAQSAIAPPETESSVSKLEPPLILLAEDNQANIITTTSYLEAKGYRIVSAHNGQEAINLAQTHQPALILMDIQMPGMDGLEAIQRIRLDPTVKHIPIIALTALAMAGDREKCLAAGANDYLSKPVKLRQLVSTIQQILEAIHQP